MHLGQQGLPAHPHAQGARLPLEDGLGDIQEVLLPGCGNHPPHGGRLVPGHLIRGNQVPRDGLLEGVGQDLAAAQHKGVFHRLVGLDVIGQGLLQAHQVVDQDEVGDLQGQGVGLIPGPGPQLGSQGVGIALRGQKGHQETADNDPGGHGQEQKALNGPRSEPHECPFPSIPYGFREWDRTMNPGGGGSDRCRAGKGWPCPALFRAS